MIAEAWGSYSNLAAQLARPRNIRPSGEDSMSSVPFYKRLDFWLFVATWALVYVTWNAVEDTRKMADTANKNFLRAQRAWLAFVGDPEIIGSPLVGEPFYIEVSHSNTGHEPALDVYFQAYVQTVNVSRGAALGVMAHAQENARRCLAIKNSNFQQVVYPGNAIGKDRVLVTADLVTDDFIKGITQLNVEQCATYKTSGDYHHSTNCFHVLMRGVKPEFAACDIGMVAD
jgi:hypothetical protein